MTTRFVTALLVALLCVCTGVAYADSSDNHSSKSCSTSVDASSSVTVQSDTTAPSSTTSGSTTTQTSAPAQVNHRVSWTELY